MAKLFANGGDPDQMPRSVVSDPGLHCLPITCLQVSRLQRVNSTLGKIFSTQHFEIFLLIFPRKQDLTFHANYLQWRQFEGNARSCFLGKIRKMSICCLLNLPREW